MIEGLFQQVWQQTNLILAQWGLRNIQFLNRFYCRFDGLDFSTGAGKLVHDLLSTKQKETKVVGQVADVEKLLKKFRVCKVLGPDCLNNYLLKTCHKTEQLHERALSKTSIVCQVPKKSRPTIIKRLPPSYTYISFNEEFRALSTNTSTKGQGTPVLIHSCLLIRRIVLCSDSLCGLFQCLQHHPATTNGLKTSEHECQP